MSYNSMASNSFTSPSGEVISIFGMSEGGTSFAAGVSSRGGADADVSSLRIALNENRLKHIDSIRMD